MVDTELAVVGGGVAGLQASLSASSEGIDTYLINGGEIGGQIWHTPHLENSVGAGTYGVPGKILTTGVTAQCERLGVTILKQFARHLEKTPNGLKIHTENETVTAKCVVIATGASFAKIGIPGESLLQVQHGVAGSWGLDTGDMDIVVVGGGNSAGQAILHLAGRSTGKIHVLARSGLKTSQYITDRIENSSKVIVHRSTPKEVSPGAEENTCIVHLHDGKKLKTCVMFVCAGMKPNSSWLPESVYIDNRGKIKTGTDYQTSVPDVYAIGDVRSGAVNRVPSAIGEGSNIQPVLWNALRA